MKVRFSSEVLAAIRTHAAAEPGREVCGLLFGSPERIDGVMAAANIAADPSRHFEIDPAALFTAIRAERVGGPRLAGYYHSHPGGRAEPSAIDNAMAAPDGKIWVIVAGDTVRAWRTGTDGFAALEIEELGRSPQVGREA